MPRNFEICLCGLGPWRDVRSGCAGTNVSVGAGNGAVAAYPSSVGNVNTPQFALGDLVAVDTKTHRSWKFGAVNVDPTDVAISATSSDRSEPFDSSFDLIYSKKLGPVIEDQVGETVRRQSVPAHGKLFHPQHQESRRVYRRQHAVGQGGDQGSRGEPGREDVRCHGRHLGRKGLPEL